MASRAATEFDRKLQKLFRERTHWLRSLVRKPGTGRAPIFSKKKVDASIRKLQASATACLLRQHAIKDFRRMYDLKKQWHVKNKGWGNDEKRKNFKNWYEAQIPHDNCIYVFWAKGRCRYVGRTLKGKNRPQSQFQKHWFPGVTRVDIYATRAARDMPQQECLATHRFKPTHSKIKPATVKWYSKCPICDTHKHIRNEVKAIFRLK